MKFIFRTRTKCLVVGLVFIFAAGALNSMAQDDRLIGGVGITLFDRANFNGQAVTFRENVPNLANRGFGNRAQSLRVGAGEQWEVCDLANYRGQCIVVSGEERNLRDNGWNNRISSLRRVGGGTPPDSDGYIVLFTGPRYTGNPTNYNSSRAFIQKSARSVTIGRGTWQVCNGIRFTGRCVTLTESVPNLNSYNIGRVIRSLRPVGFVPPGPTPVPPVANPYMVLFDRVNYRGVPTNYNRSETSIAKTARSATIGRGVWEVCDGRNFTGRCQTLRQSAPDLRTYNIGLVIRSVRPVGR